jgi:hypothetical protein
MAAAAVLEGAALIIRDYLLTCACGHAKGM